MIEDEIDEASCGVIQAFFEVLLGDEDVFGDSLGDRELTFWKEEDDLDRVFRVYGAGVFAKDFLMDRILASLKDFSKLEDSLEECTILFDTFRMINCSRSGKFLKRGYFIEDYLMLRDVINNVLPLW